MENKQKKSSGIMTGIFCALAGAAIGVGSCLVYNELSKDKKAEEKKSKMNLVDVREQIKKKNEKSTPEQETLNEAEYESFFCPISQEIMKDPVITPQGISFDRQSILEWLKRDNKCPITKMALKESDLITNYALKNTIDDYLQKNK
jgi:STIP1 family protein 1